MAELKTVVIEYQELSKEWSKGNGSPSHSFLPTKDLEANI